MSKTKLKKVADALQGKTAKLVNYNLFEIGKNALHKVRDMLQTVVQAACESTSVEVEAELSGGPSADDIRFHLDGKVKLDAVVGMMRDRLRWLTKILVRKFGNCLFDMAVDCTDEMYYGELDNPYIVGTKPQAGTSYAHKYLTMSIVMNGRRYFLFSFPIFERGNLLYYLNKAILFSRELGIRTKQLFVDREFETTDILAFLKDEKIFFVMPKDNDCKFRRLIAEAKSFPIIFNGWQTQNKDGETVETNLVVIEKIVQRKDGTIEKQHRGFFTNLPREYYKDKPEKIAELYRKRWGIETAHRCEDEFRIKSTSKNGIVRYLYFLMGVLVYNLWVYLNLLLCKDVENFKIQVKKDVMKHVLRMIFYESRL